MRYSKLRYLMWARNPLDCIKIYGNLMSPPELKTYLRGMRLDYNYDAVQPPREWNCGHLFLHFFQ
ncbi:hypothetical protein PR048_012094, partial [Dryococelus australis]